MADTDDLVDAMVETSFVTMAALNRLAAENDLSLTQVRVLAILRDRRLRMSVLADYLGLEKSTLSGLVERAEKRGLLDRAPSTTDGRAVDVFLSTAGAELFAALFAELEKSLSARTAALSAAERRRLTELLLATRGPRGL